MLDLHIDDLLRHEGDNPSIGMILCKTKDNVFVEYVLRNFNRPIGVAEYETKIIESLPDDLKGVIAFHRGDRTRARRR